MKYFKRITLARVISHTRIVSCGNILVGINFDYWRCLCRRCSANGNAINLNAYIPAWRIEFPDKRRFVKKGFEYLSMATSGKLTLRGIPKPQCHECVFLIPVSEKRRSRYDGGKSRIDPFLSFHWDRGEEACKIYLLTARSFSTEPFKADNCITLHCTFQYLWGITWFLVGSTIKYARCT